MKIQVETENCDYENRYLINQSADSTILLTIELQRIVSVQSKKIAKINIIKLIQSELKKFKWIISGSVLVDFIWYLNSVERQETDKIGDLDNITKPIQDSLIGVNGVLIDDSQIGGLYTYWITRNQLLVDNILKIKIRFNNDYSIWKKNLKFIQYDGAICMPLNVDLADIKSLYTAKLIIDAKINIRSIAKEAKGEGANIDNYIVVSEWDYHKSRLNAFQKKDIIRKDEFEQLCIAEGLTTERIREMKNEASS